MRIAYHVRCDTSAAYIQDVLAQAGFDGERFLSETSLLRTLRRQSFDLILVDAVDAGPDEQHLYSWSDHRTGKTTPVVTLSAASESVKVAQTLGADEGDCPLRPFDPVALIARLHATLSSRHITGSTIDVAGFSLDRETCSIADRGVAVELSPHEFTLAWLLFSAPGVRVSHATISASLWTAGAAMASGAIEQDIDNLCKKLNLSAERGVQLRTTSTQEIFIQLGSDAVSAAPLQAK